MIDRPAAAQPEPGGHGPAAAVVAAVRAGRISAVQAARDAAARIAAGAALNAVVDFDPDEGARHAALVDARLAAGEDLALAGLPVVIKDNIWVGGRRVTQGSLLFKDFIAPRDATAVARLRAAGAVVMGMANTSEFACKGLTNNKLYGPTLHPMDPALTPGGSSGGPASAVAGGLVPAALGTDAGGSSRRPPAHVGAVGFKPSFGALPYGPGFAEPFTGLSCTCPITLTVGDAALLFDVLSGQDPLDPDTIPIAPPDPPGAELRVAFSPRFGLDVPVDPAVSEAMERVAEALGRAGVMLVRRDPTWPDGATESALMPLQHAGLAALHGQAYRDSPDLIDPDVGAQIASGLACDGVAVAQARRLGGDVARAVAAYFTGVDLVVGPTVPCTAWPWTRLGPETIGGVPVPARGHAVFTPLFNFAMTPAISIPCGRAPGGLPLGLQIVGPRGRDRRVLAFAARAEAILAEAGLWTASAP